MAQKSVVFTTQAGNTEHYINMYLKENWELFQVIPITESSRATIVTRNFLVIMLKDK